MKRWLCASLALIFYASTLPWNARAVDYWRYNASDINFENYGLMDNAYKLSSPYVDVRAYGADNTGVADSYAAIAAAYNSGKFYIFIPEGTYKTSATLSPPLYVRIAGVPNKTIIQPTAAVTKAFEAGNSGNYYGLVFDGTNTTGATGFSVGGGSLVSDIHAEEIVVKNFTGTGAKGVVIDNVATFEGDKFYVNNNATGLYVGGSISGVPTNSLFYRSAFRASTNEGAYVIDGAVGFDKCLFEANEKEGLKVIPSAGRTTKVDVLRSWFEANWGGDTTTEYDIKLDGTAANSKLNATVRDTKFANTASTEKAIYMWNINDVVIDNPTIANVDNSIVVATDSLATGKPVFINWPHKTATFTSVVADDNNMIQTRDGWRSWTPSYSASGSMTYAGVTSTTAKFNRMGKTIDVILYFSGTVGGTPSDHLILTMPDGIVAALSGNIYNAAVVTDNSVASLGWVQFSGSNINIYKMDASNFTAGAGGAFFTATIEIN